MTVFTQTEPLSAGANVVDLGGPANQGFPPAPNWLDIVKNDETSAVRLWVRTDGTPAAIEGTSSVPSEGSQNLRRIPLNRSRTRSNIRAASPNWPQAPCGMTVHVHAEAACVATFEVG